MSNYDEITNRPVIIDNGSGVIKAGFAGEQKPSCVLPSCIGRPKHSRAIVGGGDSNSLLEGELFVGDDIKNHRGLFKLNYPMQHGTIRDWASMEYLWQQLYTKKYLNVLPDNHPVLITEAALNPTKHREIMAQVFFESLHCPALMISMQALLSLYATGRTTGVVLDSGDGVTHAVPVYEGFALQNSIMRSDIAGRDVTSFLKLLLRKEGHNFYTTAEFEVVRTIKEKACYVSPTPLVQDFSQFYDKTSYNLPDGTTIELDSCRVKAPEMLFRPELVGSECDSISQCLSNSISLSDLDLRTTLCSNIVLSGGSTLYRGFGERLLFELKRSLPKDIKLRISAPSERLYATWMGGSILASLDTFKRLWISKKEYDEEGARILYKKTL